MMNFTFIVLCICALVVNSKQGLVKDTIDRRQADAVDLEDAMSELENSRDICGNPPARLSEAEQKESVDEHNRLRSLVGSSNMLKMEWDNELANMAQLLADTCMFEHGNSQMCSDADVTVGQNLYIRAVDQSVNKSTISWDGLVGNAIVAWYNEFNNYTLSTNQCDKGSMCGHYTELVWAETQTVGCAYNLCDKWYDATKTYNSLGMYFVCNYHKVGNLAGKRPFTPGEPCSNCQSSVSTKKAKCVDSMFCESCPDDSEDPDCKIASYICNHDGTFNYASGTCDCTKDYYGKHCDNPVLSGCQNGGEYNNELETCQCNEEWCGETCSEKNENPYCDYFHNQGYCEENSIYFRYVSIKCKCSCTQKKE